MDEVDGAGEMAGSTGVTLGCGGGEMAVGEVVTGLTIEVGRGPCAGVYGRYAGCDDWLAAGPGNAKAGRGGRARSEVIG